jgi:hypothetical protein
MVNSVVGQMFCLRQKESSTALRQIEVGALLLLLVLLAKDSCSVHLPLVLSPVSARRRPCYRLMAQMRIMLQMYLSERESIPTIVILSLCYLLCFVAHEESFTC